MINRRNFVKSSLLGGVSLFSIPLFGKFVDSSHEWVDSVGYRLTRDIPTRLFDGEKCWVHPRAGIVPEAGKNGSPRVVMTMNTLDLSGSDVFKGMFGLHTDDLGKSW